MDLKEQQQKQLKAFSQLCLAPDLGLYPFTQTDLDAYFNDPRCFALSLNRDRGCYVLYGKAHAQARRAFFNGLETKDKQRLFLEKVNAAGLQDDLFKTLKLDESVLVDVEDIGMGTSVYRLVFSDGSSFVLKQDCDKHLETYYAVSTLLEAPSLKSYYFKTDLDQFVCMQDLGSVNLGDLLLKQKAYFKQHEALFVKQLATHALLGDFLNRGDRHAENYLIDEQSIYPIDVAYLFYERNAFWTARYVASASYELSVCWDFFTDRAVLNHDRWRLFWMSYKESFDVLKSAQGLKKWPSDLKKKLDHSFCPKEMVSAYLDNVLVMQIRLAFKYVLEALVSQDPDILNRYALCKMYYYANQDRISAFLHLEEHSQDFFEHLEQLAYENKCVSSSFYKDLLGSLTQEKQQLEMYLKKIF